MKVFDLDEAKREIGHLVINMRVEGAEWDVRIDRQTKWGNPFKGSEAQRDETVLKFWQYARQRVVDGVWTLEELAALNGKRLACWCSPRSCHGHVLAWMAKRAYEHLQKRAA